jgi:hypothetical protein
MQRLRVARYAGILCAGLMVVGCSPDPRGPARLEMLDAADGPPAMAIDAGGPALDARVADDASVADSSTPSDGGPSDGGGDPDATAIDEPREVAAPGVLAPSHLGILVGPGAIASHEGLRLYGTDLGISFEHDGELRMLFGDSWSHAEQVCGDAPVNDDTIAHMPLSFGGELPVPRFATDPAAPAEALAIELLRGGESLTMGFGQVPMAAFSDGDRAFAFFARLEPATCDDSGQCGGDGSLACSQRIGWCEPEFTTMTLTCDLATGLGCLPGQECVAGAQVCIDPTSTQYDGSIFGETSAVAQHVELAVQGDDALHAFRSVVTWPTNKFATLSSRTVERFTGEHAGNVYAPGHGELLVWGRPGFIGEHGREAQLYLMRHGLPIELDRSGDAEFSPRYFAGLDPRTRQPRWTEDQAEAKPLALDGVLGGSPHEELHFTGQMAVSWLPAPIEKWVMLYGGDLTDLLMVDAAAARAPRAPGAIMIRFAEHPWGPWTPPEPHYAPGAPGQHGSLYGPGGVLYHPDCEGAEQAPCMPSDPWRPPDTATACLISTQAFDPGRLYGVNIIDNYTHGNDAGGLDMVWNVSLWNPYAVALMKTRILLPPGDQVAPNELADATGLRRMSNFASLPELDPGRRYRQQTSYDRGTEDTSFPLSGFGNRDFNNFLCKSANAVLAVDQFAPFEFDEPQCQEDYVRGAVLARFEGPGRHVRTWIGAASLMFAPADDEVFRVYVDGDETPRIEERLADVLDGRAGEIWKPPFGAGSPRRMAWYYPIAFQEKLIVTLDKLGELDEYFYHVDVVHDAKPSAQAPATRGDRRRAIAQLGSTYHPAGALDTLLPTEPIALAPLEHHAISLEGPATIHELELRALETDLPALAAVRIRARWDGQDSRAIDLSLLELFAAAAVPSELSTVVLTSFVEGDERVLVLKLPMPFEATAAFGLVNTGGQEVAFSLLMRGRYELPRAPFGKLHTIASRVQDNGDGTHHHSLDLEGRGRLVGACAYLAGVPDPEGGLQYDGLNLLEGDVRVWTDDALAIDGTGTEEYADDVFYFADVPHGNAFAQAWGVVNDPFQSEVGQASLCRWHVLGTELDFERSLRASFELGGAGNPEIVIEHRVISYVYLED